MIKCIQCGGTGSGRKLGILTCGCCGGSGVHPGDVSKSDFKIAGRESFTAQSPTVPGPAPDQEAHPR